MIRLKPRLALKFKISLRKNWDIYPNHFKMQNSVGIKIDLDKANIWRSSGLNQEYLTRYKSILNPPERSPWATSLRCCLKDVGTSELVWSKARCTNFKGAYILSLVRLADMDVGTLSIVWNKCWRIEAAQGLCNSHFEVAWVYIW